MDNPLHHRDFRYYLTGRFLALCASQMLGVGVGQYIYELTHSALHLGLIGLVLFLPKISFVLLAGHTADRFDRRAVILVCRLTQCVATLGLILFARSGSHELGWLYALLLLVGTANSFEGPATQAIVPALVPAPIFSRAVAWNASVMQAAFIAGPALGGCLYAFGNVLGVFYAIATMRLLSAVLIALVRTRTGRMESAELSWQTLLAGLNYVFRTKVVLGTISLDLFAVLFGGAVALMPIYANDILRVGPSGLGILRAAPAAGAALMALFFAHRPPIQRAGSAMLGCVAMFGLATILFGISHNFYFSLACLVILGASDMVSVVIRGVLVQMQTPPEMRGRVSAVNLVFIGASNELGEFESGLTAAWFGTIPAVVLGGLGTLAVVALWAWRFPEVRAYRSP